jgi:hypothetical protein
MPSPPLGAEARRDPGAYVRRRRSVNGPGFSNPIAIAKTNQLSGGMKRLASNTATMSPRTIAATDSSHTNLHPPISEVFCLPRQYGVKA